MPCDARLSARVARLAAAVGCALACTSMPAAAAPADLAYRHGRIYTVDPQDSVQQAVAVRGGLVVYVGGDSGLTPFLGPKTRIIDLHGRLLMPGLVDGHMHPLQGGAALRKCSLNYKQLSVAAFRDRIQTCLDAGASQEPDGWLEVVNWFQEGMIPAGVVTDRSVLDSLHTHRPVIVTSSFGHTSLVNSRAIALAGITAASTDPLGGKIWHDAKGAPTGLLDDAAQDLVSSKLPPPTPEDDRQAALAALDALRRQGVTTFLDAAAEAPALEAFARVQRDGGLTARAHFALLIPPAEGPDPKQAVAKVSALARRYDGGTPQPAPGLTVRNVKLFLDGVISAPALSGAMLQPYFVPPSTAGGAWEPGSNRGPDVYFPAPVLAALLVEVVAAGFEPHMHADGDRAVREGLDGMQALRKAYPGRDLRLAIAHDEIVDPADFPRYAALNVLPVLSFQWEKPASDTVDNARDYLGPARYRYMEPAAFLAGAGARIAFGSDWPVDRLDEWFALKVGVTRTNAPSAGAAYAGRLSADAGLSRAAVLRAITMNSSYELHQDGLTGSLERGKFADLIVLDRDVLTVPAEDIAATTVLQTVVGGRVVYEAAAL